MAIKAKSFITTALAGKPKWVIALAIAGAAGALAALAYFGVDVSDVVTMQ